MNDKAEYDFGSNPTKDDSDGDGLSDLDEFVNQTDPNKSDTDEDGMTDLDEIQAGLDPLKVDGDGDGIPDYFEIDLVTNIFELSAEGDFDSDGLTDLAEYNSYTMPNKTDTDGDGLNDKDEYTRGSDPLAPDTDLDGLSDLVETNTGIYVSLSNTGTDPTKSDTDGDTFADLDEIQNQTDPSNLSAYPRLPEPQLYFTFEGSAKSIADRSLNGKGVTSTLPDNFFGVGAPSGTTPSRGIIFSGDTNPKTNRGISNNNYIEVPSYKFDDVIGEEWNDTDSQVGYTFSAWIKPSEFNGENYLFAQKSNSDGVQIGIRWDCLVISHGRGDWLRGKTKLNDYVSSDSDGWIHVLYHYDGFLFG